MVLNSSECICSAWYKPEASVILVFCSRLIRIWAGCLIWVSGVSRGQRNVWSRIASAVIHSSPKHRNDVTWNGVSVDGERAGRNHAADVRARQRIFAVSGWIRSAQRIVPDIRIGVDGLAVRWIRDDGVDTEKSPQPVVV